MNVEIAASPRKSRKKQIKNSSTTIHLIVFTRFFEGLNLFVNFVFFVDKKGF